MQKYDYDSSSVRKRFFREALLQITIPFLLKKLAPTCKSVSMHPLSPPQLSPSPPMGPWGSLTSACPCPFHPCRSCPGSKS